MYAKNLFYITINMFMNLLFIQILKFLFFLTTSQSVVKVTKKDIAHSTPCLFFYINSIKKVSFTNNQKPSSLSLLSLAFSTFLAKKEY